MPLPVLDARACAARTPTATRCRSRSSRRPHGDLSPADRGVTYTPDPGYSGADAIGVMATDGDLVAREALRMHVADTAFCTPDDPLRVRPGHGGEAQVECTTPDARSTVLSVVAQPAKGVASQQWFGVRPIRCQASSLESGADSFTFRASSEDFGVSPIATQEVVIDPEFNHAPSCNEHDIPYVARAQEATDIRLFCSDADIDPLAYTVTRAPAGGAATVDGDRLTYTPDAGFDGLDEVGVEDRAHDAEALTASVQATALIRGEHFLAQAT